MRRSSVTGFKSAGSRRRSSANYTSASAAGRRCSLSTFGASSRIRSTSKAFIPEEDLELCQPSVEDLPVVSGYENLSFEPYIVPPPSIPVAREDEPEEANHSKPIKTISALSVENAHVLLIRYADSRCIYNKDAARDMRITSMEYQPRYKYTLESFTESREIAWCHEPYSGEPLDEFTSAQSIPAPWSIEIQSPKTFQTQTSSEIVPHTDVVMTCHACGGVGSKRCNACSAVGWERCSFCLGDGHKMSLQGQRERCFRCLGTGRKKCWKCGGDTIAVCRGCGGTGQIKCFITLTVNWSSHVDSLTIETPDASSKIDPKLEFAKGIVVFEEEMPMVNPAIFPESEEMHSLSSSRIEKHKELLETDKILLQRHSIRTIPVYYITYEWKQRTRCYFIYDLKNEVYAPEYPEQICCCNLM